MVSSPIIPSLKIFKLLFYTIDYFYKCVFNEITPQLPKSLFKNPHYFSKARSCLFHVFKYLQSKDGNRNEVILSNLNILCVPKSILDSGLKPVFVDVKNDWNVDIQDLENKITKKTIAIVITHLFGTKLEFEHLINKCKQLNIFIIEDYAQSINLIVNKKVQNFNSDFQVFSFGQFKSISSIHGGIVTTKHVEANNYFTHVQKKLTSPSFKFSLNETLKLILIDLISYRLFYNLYKIIEGYAPKALEYWIDKIFKKKHRPSIEMSYNFKLGNFQKYLIHRQLDDYLANKQLKLRHKIVVCDSLAQTVQDLKNKGIGAYRPNLSVCSKELYKENNSELTSKSESILESLLLVPIHNTQEETKWITL